jgi:hypothetical protein
MVPVNVPPDTEDDPPDGELPPSAPLSSVNELSADADTSVPSPSAFEHDVNSILAVTSTAAAFMLLFIDIKVPLR